MTLIHFFSFFSVNVPPLGETDWKVLVIDVNDPLADKLNDIEDIERHLPGFIDATRDWFRIYKKPDGKPENEFAFEGAAKDKAYATKVIEDTHAAWKRLISGAIPPKTEAYDIKVYVTQISRPGYIECIGPSSSSAHTLSLLCFCFFVFF